MKAVALGGGHGTAVTLQALRRIADDVTGVISTADDGGSSGLLRTRFGIPAVGDIRRCLSANVDPANVLGTHLESRIGREQHPLGNLLLLSALLEAGNLATAVERVSRMVDAQVRVLPATTQPVQLEAVTTSGLVVGQSEIHRRDNIVEVALTPSDIRASDEALKAIMDADLVVAGPGSLFTSVLATLVVPGIREAISESHGRFVWLTNLHPEVPESMRLGVSEQYERLLRHGVHPDVVMCDETALEGESLDFAPLCAPLSAHHGFGHDPFRVAQALRSMMAN